MKNLVDECDEYGWTIIPFDGIQHVMPVDEMEIHFPNDCKCCPEHDEEENIIVHKSFDNREAFEYGERKVS